MPATPWGYAHHGATDAERCRVAYGPTQLFGSACRLSDLRSIYSADDVAAIVAASTVKPPLRIAQSLSALLSLTAFLSLAAAQVEEGDHDHVTSAGTDLAVVDDVAWCSAVFAGGLSGVWRLVRVVDPPRLRAVADPRVTVALYIRVSNIDAGPELTARSMQAQLISCALHLHTLLRDLKAVADVVVRPVR
jgi:hypothetical protein